jgi:hypothetical protein
MVFRTLVYEIQFFGTETNWFNQEALCQPILSKTLRGQLSKLTLWFTWPNFISKATQPPGALCLE